jgi:uncharacterized protein YbjT (DUF2867 family)
MSADTGRALIHAPQGSSVLKAVLADGTFTPRAITRNPESDAAKKLSAQGIEVVKGDLFNKESIIKAINGSQAVFGVCTCSCIRTGCAAR